MPKPVPATTTRHYPASCGGCGPDGNRDRRGCGGARGRHSRERIPGQGRGDGHPGTRLPGPPRTSRPSSVCCRPIITSYDRTAARTERPRPRLPASQSTGPAGGSNPHGTRHHAHGRCAAGALRAGRHVAAGEGGHRLHHTHPTRGGRSRYGSTRGHGLRMSAPNFEL